MAHNINSAKESNQRKRLDSLFSEYIRRRAISLVGGCQKCGTLKFDIPKDNGSILPGWKQLQCSHFISKRHLNTRWDLDNAIGACGACHINLTGHPIEHQELMVKILGAEGVLLLQARMREIGKVDREAVKLYLQHLLKEIDGG